MQPYRDNVLRETRALPHIRPHVPQPVVRSMSECNTLNFRARLVADTPYLIYPATLPFWALCPCLGVYKTNFAESVEVQCPPAPPEAELLRPHLSALLQPHPTCYRLWETNPIPHPAGSACPTPTKAQVVGRFWKLLTVCEPLGRSRLVSHCCNLF